jgi:hypothetical protein
MVAAPRVIPPFPFRDLLTRNAPFNDWRDDLARDGYAVVKGAIPREKALEYRSRALGWLESFGRGFDRNKPETFSQEFLPFHQRGGMYTSHGIHQEQWVCRRFSSSFSPLFFSDEPRFLPSFVESTRFGIFAPSLVSRRPSVLSGELTSSSPRWTAAPSCSPASPLFPRTYVCVPFCLFFRSPLSEQIPLVQQWKHIDLSPHREGFFVAQVRFSFFPVDVFLSTHPSLCRAGPRQPQ